MDPERSHDLPEPKNGAQMTPKQIILEHMRKIGSKGGNRRSQTTSKERRREIARQAGLASGRARRKIALETA